MVIIKFWRVSNNIYVGEGLKLKNAFWDLLNCFPDFFEKCASFEYDELKNAVECGYLVEEDEDCFDFSEEDEEGNTSYYSYTDEGVAELLFRAKDRNNYDYEIIEI